MLNRRILRVKTMQALYGYFTTVESLKEVSRAKLKSEHSLDPAKHDFADKALFEERKKQVVRLFNINHLLSEIDTSEKIEPEVLESVEREISSFQNKLSFETKNRRSEMLKDAHRIYDIYLKFLALPMELEHREKLDHEKKPKQKATPFIDNSIIEEIKTSDDFNKEISSRNINWTEEQLEIKSWYRQEIQPAEALKDFFEGTQEKLHLVHELFKRVIFKNENIVSYLETKYLHWSENQPIIKSLLLKTIKSVESGEPFQLADLTKNGKEDFDFFLQLYDGVLEHNEFLDEIIAGKTQNWDVDRIALTDRVILKIALVEMMTCRSIPTKVSINEAIEISKVYSTPKSKQFINGVLDVLSNELTSMGKVRKSGRGLIDNK